MYPKFHLEIISFIGTSERFYSILQAKGKITTVIKNSHIKVNIMWNVGYIKYISVMSFLKLSETSAASKTT